MKKQFHLLIIIVLAALVQSCLPEEPIGPDTGDVRDKFTGRWIFIDNNPKRILKSTFEVVISIDPSNSSQVLLSNFGNPGSGSNPAIGIVTSSRITVTSQITAPDFRVEGSGILTNVNKMNWTYSITAGGNKDNYTATATKQ